MTPEFERLIEAAIADGTVTDKEREVLHRKARTLGLDTDEVDMIVEAKLHGVRSTSKPTKAMKCPQCGAAISGLTRVCQDCGHIFEDGGPGGAPDIHKTLANVQNLLVELRSIPAPGSAQDLDEQRARMVGGLFGKSVPDQPATLRYEACLGKIENERRTMSIYFGSDPRVKSILAEIDGAIEKQKQSGQAAKNRQQRAMWVSLAISGGVCMLSIASIGRLRMSLKERQQNVTAVETKAERQQSVDHEPDHDSSDEGDVNVTGSRKVGERCTKDCQCASKECKGFKCVKRDESAHPILSSGSACSFDGDCGSCKCSQGRCR